MSERIRKTKWVCEEHRILLALKDGLTLPYPPSHCALATLLDRGAAEAGNTRRALVGGGKTDIVADFWLSESGETLLSLWNDGASGRAR